MNDTPKLYKVIDELKAEIASWENRFELCSQKNRGLSDNYGKAMRKLSDCRIELSEITEALNDARTHNTHTIAEMVVELKRENTRLTAILNGTEPVEEEFIGL